MTSKLCPALLAATLATAAAPAFAADPAGQCADNFAVDGSWSSGKSYTTAVQQAGDYGQVYDRLLKAITDDGMILDFNRKETGYIRASNPVKGGQGGTATAPLRGKVQRMPGGEVKIDLTFTIAGGQMTPKKAVLGAFCKYTDSAFAP